MLKPPAISRTQRIIASVFLLLVAAAGGGAALASRHEHHVQGTPRSYAAPPRLVVSNVRSTIRLTLRRETIVPQTVGRVGEAHVSGQAAGSRDFNSLISARLPLVMAFVILLTFLLMLASFRSVSVALSTVLLNVLSVACAYGLLVLVFQHHWFDGVLGTTTNGAIVAWLPLFLFVILFGLSMDYHVFVLSRIREAVQRGASPEDAISEGVRTSAGVVTSAAVVMMAAFGIFATLSTIDMKQLGIGLASAVAIDATIVRGVLLPATLQLLGRRAWEESRVARAIPAIGHRELA